MTPQVKAMAARITFSDAGPWKRYHPAASLPLPGRSRPVRSRRLAPCGPVRVGPAVPRPVLVAEQRVQAEQRAAGAVLEAKLCATLAKLAANKPPAGNPQTNPSRAYDQNNHAILDELGPDLGCGPKRPG